MCNYSLIFIPMDEEKNEQGVDEQPETGEGEETGSDETDSGEGSEE